VLRAACVGLAGSVAAFLGLGSPGASWAWVCMAALLLGYLACALPLSLLDGAVAAVYVVFAEHPVPLAFHFPMVHHRFARIAEFALYDR